MSIYVLPGRTLHLHGTLDAGQRLVANSGYYGANGALLVVGQAASNDGTIILQGSVSEETYQEAASSTLVNYGVLTNNGAISVTGAAFYAPGPIDPGALLLNDGVLLNNGVIMLGGLFNPYSVYGTSVPGRLDDNGTMQNTGLVIVDGFHAGYYNDHGTSPGQLNVNGVLINDGGLQVDSGNLGYGGAGATVIVAGMLTNAADGVVTGDGESAGCVLNVVASGTLSNAGVFVMIGGGDVGGRLNVAGMLDNSGMLQLQAGYGSFRGQTGGAMLTLTGTMSNSGVVMVDDRAAGYFRGREPGGAMLNNAGLLTNAGSIAVYGGSFGSYYGQAAPGVLIDSGQLHNAPSGVIALIGGQAGYIGTGGATLDVRGVLGNAGLITVGAGIGVAGVGAGSGGVLIDRGTIYNSGSLEIQDGAGVGAAGVLVDAGLLINSGLMSVGAGAGVGGLLVTAAGTLDDSGTIAGGGTLVNDGVIGGHGMGEITVARLLNSGTIGIAVGSAFTVGGDVTAASGGHGVFDIEGTGRLTFAGPVAASQSILFQGNDGTLGIGDAGAFGGVLDLDERHLTLDFLTRDVVSAGASGTTLEIGFPGGATVDYTLAAPLAAGTTIGLQSDAHGGTNVVFSGAAGPGAGHGAMSGGYASGVHAGAASARVDWIVHPA